MFSLRINLSSERWLACTSDTIRCAAASCSDRHRDIYPCPTPSSSATSSEPPPGYFYPFRVGLRDTAQAIRSFRRPITPPSTPSVQTVPTEAAVAPASATSMKPSVQVTLAIAMPVTRACQSGVPLYALGNADVVWSGDSLG